MYIVVYEVVAVLEVLTFGNAVRGDEYVNVCRARIT